jgi:site-specific recombinase XerD
MNGHSKTSKGLEAACKRYVQLRRATWHPTTVRQHDYRLKSFLRCLRALDPGLRHFDQVRRHPHIEHWLIGLQRLQPVSRLAELHTLRQFLQAQIDWGWPHAPAEDLLRDEDFPRLPRHLPKPLDPAEDEALQEALRKDGCLRSLAILVLRRTGLRVGELLGLTVDAIGVDAQGKSVLRVPPGKTYRERMVPLSKETVTILGQVLQRRGSRCAPVEPLDKRLMLEESGEPMSYHSLWRHLKRVGRRAGVCAHQSLHLHRMRHTFATELARTTIPFPSLMRLLGHRKPDMTMRYVELSARDIRYAYEHAMGELPALPVLARPAKNPDIDPDAAIRAHFNSLIARIERHRRDQRGGAGTAQALTRLVKRLRAAQHAFKLTP